MHQHASLKSRCLMGVGHLLCHLQLQAALVSRRESFASRGLQQPTPHPAPALGPWGSVTAGAQGPRPRPPPSCGAALPRTGGGGRGTTGLPGPRRGWDRSLTAGKELEKPVAGSGRASFPPQPLPPPQLLLLPAAAPGAALSPLFGDREDRSGLNERFCVTTT